MTTSATYYLKKCVMIGVTKPSWVCQTMLALVEHKSPAHWQWETGWPDEAVGTHFSLDPCSNIRSIRRVKCLKIG